ncbi:hypothetical protein BZM27_52125 [Paraburkholderia steynii]|uniref:Uncharacterized protein n=1 Tax=Paraburkholderia steynii TaxID=1245441 RepID=A0A4R0X2Q1_9BURK|nr:hypothetical protein BZM27_52125 [Paraburkholderia steynii]
MWRPVGRLADEEAESSMLIDTADAIARVVTATWTGGIIGAVCVTSLPSRGGGFIADPQPKGVQYMRHRKTGTRDVPAKTSEELRTRLRAFALATRDAAMRRARIPFPDDVTVLAVPFPSVAHAGGLPWTSRRIRHPLALSARE